MSKLETARKRTGNVRCRIQHAWGWCTGMIQRDVMGREVGGGFMFGNACTPVVDSSMYGKTNTEL